MLTEKPQSAVSLLETLTQAQISVKGYRFGC